MNKRILIFVGVLLIGVFLYIAFSFSQMTGNIVYAEDITSSYELLANGSYALK